MDYLLDTCVAIWIFEGSPRIPERVRDRLTRLTATLYLSDVSLLEIVIKYRMGKFPLAQPPSRVLPPLARKHSIEILPLSSSAIFDLENLPDLHRDPFDRLLVAQSRLHGLTLVTPDPLVRQYDCDCFWI